MQISELHITINAEKLGKTSFGKLKQSIVLLIANETWLGSSSSRTSTVEKVNVTLLNNINNKGHRGHTFSRFSRVSGECEEALSSTCGSYDTFANFLLCGIIT